MLGNNVMKLNGATMMAALQHYFDTVLFAEGKAPRVENIILGGSPALFDVHVTDRESKP